MAWGTESGFGQGDPVPEDLGLYIMCYPGLFTFTKMSTPHASDSLVWVVSIGRRVQSLHHPWPSKEPLPITAPY